MKALIFSLLLVTTNAFALNICDYEDWSDLLQDMYKQNISAVKQADIRNLTKKEIRLIHKTVKLNEWSTDFSEQEALEEFLELWEGRIGDLAGDIKYYRLNGKNMISAIYYPGDNVYGAYWFERSGKYELIAYVDDSAIVCK